MLGLPTRFQTWSWGGPRKILQHTRTFYLAGEEGSNGGQGYLSQIEPLKESKSFGSVPATPRTSWVQRLGTRFGSEGGSNLTSFRKPLRFLSSTEMQTCRPKNAAEAKLASPNAVLGKQTGRLNVKKLRVVPKPLQQKKREANSSNLFVFCERRSGVAQFRAASHVDFDCTVERIAGMLAMQCLVRGQEPGDFEVMVPAEGSLVDRLVVRAQELLEEGRAVACPASLSPRQREVLHSVINNRANKEIASKLNITVRTVKFHISTLLSKFGVDSRSELARRAAGFVRPTMLEDESPLIEQRSVNAPQSGFRPVAMEAPLRIANKSRSVRFPGRVLTA